MSDNRDQDKQPPQKIERDERHFSIPDNNDPKQANAGKEVPPPPERPDPATFFKSHDNEK